MTSYHLGDLFSCWEEGVVVNEREGMAPIISNPIPEHLEYFHVFVLLFIHLFLEKGPMSCCLRALVAEDLGKLVRSRRCLNSKGMGCFAFDVPGVCRTESYRGYSFLGVGGGRCSLWSRELLLGNFDRRRRCRGDSPCPVRIFLCIYHTIRRRS